MLALLIPALVISLVAGCGGSRSGSPAGQEAQGAARITVHWPPRADESAVETAMIPARADSILVEFADSDGVFAQGIIERPSTSETFPLPAQELTVRATAHPYGDAGGNVLAQAETTAVIPVNQTVQINLELASTVAAVEVRPDPAFVDVGGQGQLRATARNAAGAIVLVGTDNPFAWANESGVAHATVSADGVVQAVSEGEAVIKATEVESGISGTCSVVVTAAANGSGGGGGGGALAGKIAYTSDGPGGQHLVVMNADGSGWPRYPGRIGACYHPSWHPDGTQVLVSGWSCPVDGMQWWQCVLGGDAPPCMDWDDLPMPDPIPTDGNHPVWSPGGSHIMVYRGQSQDQRLWVLDYNAGDPPSSTSRQLTDREAHDAVWSPGGTMVAFASPTADETWQIFVTDLAGATRRLTDTSDDHGRSPTWSPDESMIAFSLQLGSLCRHVICTINIDGTGMKEILGDTEYSRVGPRWSPNGSKIAFMRRGPSCSYPGAPQLCVMNADGSGETPLTDPRNIQSWDWSPTSGHIVFSRDNDIWVVQADGSRVETRLTDDERVNEYVAWSPF